MITVIPISELKENRLQVFSVENEKGAVIQVVMHPKCYVDMCAASEKALCPFCLLRLDVALRTN